MMRLMSDFESTYAKKLEGYKKLWPKLHYSMLLSKVLAGNHEVLAPKVI